MKILVTGSSGTIGTRLCETLLERGDHVIGVDWAESKWQPAVEAVTLHTDLRDAEAVRALDIPKDIDVVIHLAANARVYELVEHPNRARDNVLTLFNALELTRQHGIPRFMFASSRESYGNIPAKELRENMARIENCESPYTASKIAGEAFVESYTRCYGLDHIIFRFSNVYGAYDDSERVVPLFIRRAKKNEPLTVFGKEKCLDFTYIDDAVAGILAALDRFEDAKNGTYNIACGKGTTLIHLAERVKELLKSASPVDVGDSRTGEVIRYVADITKARRILGYEPNTSFEEGIRKAVAWYEECM
ncbi:MAG: NAD-dependent epimerase/dehydratase family protein [Candidatus Peribacteraceae bacterium]|nr:NAD-dependent epimerase/dehydratase family protein [Candidatus Peribacteraceae bacterium]